MKATELMIGDWLQHASGKYFQVTRIDMWGDGSVHFACGHPHLWEYNNKFSPIPLTEEILEKNGFVYKEEEETCATEAFHHWWLEGSAFALNDDSWWRSIKDGNLHVKFGIFPLKYVHQLQHALRLCGIDKTIEL